MWPIRLALLVLVFAAEAFSQTDPRTYHTTSSAVKVWHLPSTPTNCLTSAPATATNGQVCATVLDSTANGYTASGGSGPTVVTASLPDGGQSASFAVQTFQNNNLNAQLKNTGLVELAAYLYVDTVGKSYYLYAADNFFNTSRITFGMEGGKGFIEASPTDNVVVTRLFQDATAISAGWHALLFQLNTSAGAGAQGILKVDGVTRTNDAAFSTASIAGPLANTNSNQTQIGRNTGNDAWKMASYAISIGELMDSTQASNWATAITASYSGAPTPTPTPVGTPALKVWANEGGDKVFQDELRMNTSAPAVINSVWDGTNITLSGAKNETLGTALILEAPGTALSNVTVSTPVLTCTGGGTISSASASAVDPFNFVNRPIVMYWSRYLEIKGINETNFSYESYYCEAQIPTRFREAGSSGCTRGGGGWTTRPGANKFVPDPLVPLKTVVDATQNTIGAGKNQMVWIDVWIPKTISAGTCTGTVSVSATGVTTQNIPISLEVKNFTLPDEPSLKTMVYLDHAPVNERYFGYTYATTDPERAEVATIRQNHKKVLRRNRLTPFETGENDTAWNGSSHANAYTKVPDNATTAMDGTLYTSANGYAGPGEGLPDNLYSIGTYAKVWQGAPAFSVGGVTQANMTTYLNGWETYFQANYPTVERWIYITDEPGPGTDQTNAELWASYVNSVGGIGSLIKSFVTIGLDEWQSHTPAVDIPSAWKATMPSTWAAIATSILADSNKKLSMYNGKRPATGSFATEDEGTSPRVVAWTQYKKRVARWLYWNATYYHDNQFSGLKYDLFSQARTIGTISLAVDAPSVTARARYGEIGLRNTNGDGVLFYPGTDTLYPANSYGLDGPVESLRMKLWRRGIQDGDYLTLAAQTNSAAVDTLVSTLLPQVLWEAGETGAGYLNAGPTYSTDPAAYETARSSLATIIEAANDDTPFRCGKCRIAKRR